jgi:aminomethyltransferase
MKKTSLYEKHVAWNAKIIDFGGWAMPVQYTNVIEEHNNTRNAASLFDICHMGEITVYGPQSLDFLQYLLTRNLLDQEIGQVKLSALLNAEGGIIDDLTVYKLKQDSYMLVTNAGTLERDWQWINAIREEMGFDCYLENISDKMGKLDLQGPQAEAILQTFTQVDLTKIKYYHFQELSLMNNQVIISRSGYTGEDGFEIYAASNIIGEIWDQLLASGASRGLKPAGLGARDTLRLEAGMLLNGQDMMEEVTPLEVPYGWIVDLSKDFVGAAALAAKKQAGIKKKLVGIEMTGRGIARHGYKVLHVDKEIGVVTSGTFAPTLNKAIGLAFVDINYSVPDTEITVAIRDTLCPAKIVKLPFYKRQKKAEDSKTGACR